MSCATLMMRNEASLGSKSDNVSLGSGKVIGMIVGPVCAVLVAAVMEFRARKRERKLETSDQIAQQETIMVLKQ